jgi:hypothetical protein
MQQTDAQRGTRWATQPAIKTKPYRKNAIFTANPKDNQDNSAPVLFHLCRDTTAA